MCLIPLVSASRSIHPGTHLLVVFKRAAHVHRLSWLLRLTITHTIRTDWTLVMWWGCFAVSGSTTPRSSLSRVPKHVCRQLLIERLVTQSGGIGVLIRVHRGHRGRAAITITTTIYRDLSCKDKGKNLSDSDRINK